MRNIILCLVFLLVGTSVYAQTAGVNGRQPRTWDQAVSSVKLQSAGTDYTDNTSVVTNLVVTGNQATGNAGYLGLMAQGPDGVYRTYYLWVDGTASNGVGVLRMASFTSISQIQTTGAGGGTASFPYGDWRGSTGFSNASWSMKVSQQ